MANVYNLIDFTLESLKNFQDEELATNFINKINEYGKEFIPHVYGIYKPLKNKYNSKDTSDVIELWINEENNKKNAENYYAGGQVLMEKTKGCKVSYFMRWEKDNRARFNHFHLFVDTDYLHTENGFKKFMNLCNELILLLEPVYGEIIDMSIPGWDNPMNLRVRLPEINWMMLLGKPYIDLFGRDKILNTPCYKVEPISDNLIALQLTESIFEPITSSVRDKIKKYLGENAFVEDGKCSHAYKSGMVPKFDFSEVLFDKTKPIEEPQIRMRIKE